jgi:putative FmdB family regulatory protein
MPIYAYKCESCGHRQDVLQKISDPLLTVCPACGASAYVKQVTAAGFQLKGSGWYVTDFRDGGSNKGGSADKPADKTADKAADKPAGGGGDKATTPAASDAGSGAGSPAPAPAPAPAASPSAPSGS